MPFPSGNKIVVCFSANDNLPGAANASGWSTAFQAALGQRVSAIIGRNISVVLNEPPDPSSPWVAIISPAFFKDAACTDALKHAIANGAAIFKAVVAPVTSTEEPAALRLLYDYEFYNHAHDGTFSVLHEQSGAGATRYWTMVDDLATAIVDQLQNEISSDGPTVYLAITGDDLRVERDNIRRELQRHGVAVLPKIIPPDSLEEFERAVKTDLKKCALSIHLISASSGLIPPQSTKSMMALSHTLALAHCTEDARFQQLLWVPHHLRPSDDGQQRFVDELLQFRDVGHGTEIVQTTLEDFKTFINDKLKNVLRKSSPKMPVRNVAAASPAPTQIAAGAADPDSPKVYMMFDKQDQHAASSLSEYVHQHGVGVLLPSFDGDQMQMREAHHNNLKSCDAAIIIYGQVREPWVRIKQQDLLKAAGFGRAREMDAAAIYVCGGATENKKHFQSGGVMLIQESPSALKPFLEQLRARREGAPA